MIAVLLVASSLWQRVEVPAHVAGAVYAAPARSSRAASDRRAPRLEEGEWTTEALISKGAELLVALVLLGYLLMTDRPARGSAPAT